MNNNSYLIPANSKKSQLILGYFKMFDLILFMSGCTLTLLLLIVINTNEIKAILMILLPAIITGLLVMPVPNYHNVLTLIKNVYTYFSKTRRYYWKGWCIRDEK